MWNWKHLSTWVKLVSVVVVVFVHHPVVWAIITHWRAFFTATDREQLICPNRFSPTPKNISNIQKIIEMCCYVCTSVCRNHNIKYKHITLAWDGQSWRLADARSLDDFPFCSCLHRCFFLLAYINVIQVSYRFCFPFQPCHLFTLVVVLYYYGGIAGIQTTAHKESWTSIWFDNLFFQVQFVRWYFFPPFVLKCYFCCRSPGLPIHGLSSFVVNITMPMCWIKWKRV